MTPLYIYVLVVTLASVYHATCSEPRNMGEGIEQVRVIFDPKIQQNPTGYRIKRSLSLGMNDDVAPVLDAIAYADDEESAAVIDKTKVLHQPQIKKLTHKQRKGKRRRSRKNNGIRREFGRQKQYEAEFYGYSRRICGTTSEYNVLTEAVNNYGEKVQIAPRVGIDGTTTGLHFHESYCDTEHERCTAIVRSEYRSSCQTQYQYTYAPIIIDGKIDFSLIKIRSGCNCIIQQKKRDLFLNILDYID